MQLKAFMEQVETETVFALEKRLVQAKTRLAFLVDYASFTPSEIRLNSNTFTWHGRMPAIIDEHKTIMAEKRAQYEDALKVLLYLLSSITFSYLYLLFVEYFSFSK